MNRKNFLTAVAGLSAAFPFRSLGNQSRGQSPKRATIPKYLKDGDTIGITCPAGNITDQEIQAAVEQIENWGFKIRIGETVGKKDFIFGGTDDERARDFQRMLDDHSLHAIMCARGGYGSVRIIDRLDFTNFALHPKWIIGFSDITVIHAHLHRNYNIASIHSKMCNSFPDDVTRAEPIQLDAILSIKLALTGEDMKYAIPPNPKNKPGTASGPLVGGNLKTIESLSGTRSDIKTDGKILLVEDTGEYLYSIDRMFWNLKRTGKLSRLSGLIIGDFNTKPDDPGEEFGKTVYEIVLEKISAYNYPVCFDFPVGHQKENYAWKYSVGHRLTVAENGSTLVEHPKAGRGR